MREQIAQQTYRPIQRRSLPPNQQQRVPRAPVPPASQHRVGHNAGWHPEDMPYTTFQRQRPQPPATYETEDDDAVYTTRSPRSAVAIATRGRTFIEPVTTTGREPQPNRSFPGWLVVIAIALIVMIIGWFA